MHLHFHLFADDSNLFYSHGDLHHLEQPVNEELDRINAWLRSNTLSRKMDTVILLHFILIKKINYSIKFEIDGKPIRERTSVKYLGVLLRGGGGE